MLSPTGCLHCQQCFFASVCTPLFVRVHTAEDTVHVLYMVVCCCVKLRLCVYLCVCMCVCLCLRLHVYACLSVRLCVFAYLRLCVHVALQVMCICVCDYLFEITCSPLRDVSNTHIVLSLKHIFVQPFEDIRILCTHYLHPM